MQLKTSIKLNSLGFSKRRVGKLIYFGKFQTFPIHYHLILWLTNGMCYLNSRAAAKELVNNIEMDKLINLCSLKGSRPSFPSAYFQWDCGWLKDNP